MSKECMSMAWMNRRSFSQVVEDGGPGGGDGGGPGRGPGRGAGGVSEYMSESALVAKCKEEEEFREIGFLAVVPRGKDCHEGHLWNSVMERELHNEVDEIVKSQLKYVFYVQCASKEAKARVMTKGLSIEGNPMKLHSLEDEEVTMRMLHCPPYVRNQEVEQALMRYGRVQSIEKEGRDMDTATGEKLLKISGGRKLLIKLDEGVEKEQLPRSLIVRGYTVLLSVEGDEVKCGQCGGKGHVRAYCSNSKCVVCEGWGHSYLKCQKTLALCRRFAGGPQFISMTYVIKMRF